jgi:DNA-directed RNA polymerase specialized sigma24 family protein
MAAMDELGCRRKRVVAGSGWMERGHEQPEPLWDEQHDAAGSPEDVVGARIALWRALGTLTRDERRVLVAVAVEGLEPSAASRRLRMGAMRVMQIERAARRKLEAALDVPGGRPMLTVVAG